MTKPSLILVGAGGHARSCIDVIERQGQYQIAGLIGIPDEVQTQPLGNDVIGTDSDLQELAKTYQYALITVGQIQTAEHRIRLYQQAIQLGIQLSIIISPTAHVSRHATLGEGRGVKKDVIAVKKLLERSGFAVTVLKIRIAAN